MKAKFTLRKYIYVDNRANIFYGYLSLYSVIIQPRLGNNDIKFETLSYTEDTKSCKISGSRLFKI